MCPFQYAVLGFCHKYPLDDSTYLLLYCGELKLHLCLVNFDDYPLSKLLKFIFLL